MMMNLFSSFDPSTMFFSMNWISTLLILTFIPLPFWIIYNNYSISFFMILMMLYKEFMIILNKKYNNKSILLLSSIFMLIMLNNLLGLFPYIFTSTSHLVFNLSISLPLWLSMLIFGWINKTNHMFSHLVPLGTPFILIPFMICIETISNIIRPITLTVRLTANIIAGHLLMTLLGNLGMSINNLLIPLMISTQMTLLMLESAVSIIQSYVFSILLTLYFSEI